VRLDAGYESGDTVSQHYDNLIAKLIVWAPDREAARRRMLRAIGETRITGVATTLPAHEVILSHPDFAGATHSTKWVEETLDLSGLTAAPAGAPAPSASDDDVPTVQRDVTAEVDGRRFSVRLWVPDLGTVAVAGRPAARAKRAASHAVAGTGSGQVTVPMQGTIVKVLVAVGDVVEVGQSVCLLEAMKMENAVAAEKAGVVKEVRVSAGDPVGAGDVVAVIE
jgi:acetyl-CoA/propionyl-CoA carboxylase biotin carboxyl carrier protein